ncbi:MAG: DAK2 domain-containing protein, partial [Eubacteriales bacterium]|nr:DAK2 domain-containing protein [Eubacteriales bacterium]
MYQSDPVGRADGADVLNWFSSGAGEVAARRSDLNRINVFPVADGDTGTNLATTLNAMVAGPVPTRSFAGMLAGLSRYGLEAARGNSGIIFASYVSGLALESQSYEHVSVAEFAGIADQAVSHLYHAVSHPMEGTMMSLIRDWAAFLRGNHMLFPDFQGLFSAAYRVALVSLEKTKTQLEVLRKNNVVDSGAAGFVHFLEGINLALAGKRSTQPIFSKPVLETLAPEAAPDVPVFHYCTEALLTLPDAGNLADTIR